MNIDTLLICMAETSGSASCDVDTRWKILSFLLRRLFEGQGFDLEKETGMEV